MGSIKTKSMTAQLLASKCSQTVKLVNDIGNCLTCTSVDEYDGYA